MINIDITHGQIIHKDGSMMQLTIDRIIFETSSFFLFIYKFNMLHSWDIPYS